jgi:hypothetical protein
MRCTSKRFRGMNSEKAAKQQALRDPRYALEAWFELA